MVVVFVATLTSCKCMLINMTKHLSHLPGNIFRTRAICQLTIFQHFLQKEQIPSAQSRKPHRSLPCQQLIKSWSWTRPGYSYFFNAKRNDGVVLSDEMCKSFMSKDKRWWFGHWKNMSMQTFQGCWEHKSRGLEHHRQIGLMRLRMSKLNTTTTTSTTKRSVTARGASKFDTGWSDVLDSNACSKSFDIWVAELYFCNNVFFRYL